MCVSVCLWPVFFSAPPSVSPAWFKWTWASSSEPFPWGVRYDVFCVFLVRFVQLSCERWPCFKFFSLSVCLCSWICLLLSQNLQHKCSENCASVQVTVDMDCLLIEANKLYVTWCWPKVSELRYITFCLPQMFSLKPHSTREVVPLPFSWWLLKPHKMTPRCNSFQVELNETTK